MASTISESKCDVFVSFRGEDVRLNFASHLFDALKNTGKTVFRDDKDIGIGDQIEPELLKAIADSRVSIVIFSKNYANSKWCLKELVEIVKCRDEKKQEIMPVFYHVEPTEVRHQKGSYQKDFDKYKKFLGDTEEVRSWRSAMTRVANLSGRDLKNRPEADVINDIVRATQRKSRETSIEKGLVGIDSVMHELMPLCLEEKRNSVHIIGIYGKEGIGKTTIARVAYDKLYRNFERRCFLANVKEVFEKNGPVPLQNQLLSEVLYEENINVSEAQVGLIKIDNDLRLKTVLIILDNVDSSEQVEMLVGNIHQLGSGTKIIITTTVEHLLGELGVEAVFAAKDFLNLTQSLDLFCMKAQKQPPEGYRQLFKEVVSCAQGHPLAIEVLGSSWRDKKEHEWSNAKDELKKISSGGIPAILLQGFKGLTEMEKNLFLDIACFFKGSDIDHVIKILASHYSKADTEIEGDVEALIGKSIIKVSENKLWMHDMLQRMGQKIVRGASLHFGRRSRLWVYEDVNHVLTKHKGTGAVQSIVLNLPQKKEIQWNGEGFRWMSGLRLLKLYNVHLSKGPTDLPSGLRFLEWHGYPSQSLPSSFLPHQLTELNMCNSKIKQLWEGEIVLGNLKGINLSHSQYLTKTPNFNRIPNLEKLILDGCTSLHMVQPSHICLKNLIYMNLKGCKSLPNLAINRLETESLRELILSDCSKLKNFPDINGEMKQLSKLYLDGTEIADVPKGQFDFSNLSLRLGRRASMSMDSTSLSYSSSSTLPCNVYISFRGTDLCAKFAYNLFLALKDTGNTVLRDDQHMGKGEQIEPELLKAIAESKVLIVVFSKKYAESKLCLKELVEIVKCGDEKNKVIMPVFYNVKPRDARDQKGSYQEAFNNQDNILGDTEEMRRCRTAMKRVAALPGWDLKNSPEADVIKDIVRAIQRKLKENGFEEGLVGMDLHVTDLINLCSKKKENVHIIGIYGEEGIGKTTIATVAYDRLHHKFKRRCFLANVKDAFEKHGPVPLQKQLVSEVLIKGNINVSDVYNGMFRISNELHQEEVLIILDNVDTLEQLENLVGSRHWFSSGIIIVTTTTKQLLQEFGVDATFEAKKLALKESLELFRKACGKKEPLEESLELSRDVSYAEGHPLAIQVLASWLDKKSIAETKLSSGDIPTILQEGFRGLMEMEKKLFLDIACFFKGSDMDHVIKILASHYSLKDTEIEGDIEALIGKSLIKVSENKLWMHDMLQRMGQKIVRQKCLEEPGRRSRLWVYEDVNHVLMENTGTDAVQSIVLDLPKEETAQWKPDGFSKMKKLRLLKLYNVRLSEEPTFLPYEELRFLEWDNYPSQSLPTSFQPHQLTELIMCNSNIKQFWEGEITLENLKFINLSHSKELTTATNFERFPNLERLILEGCTQLHMVHSSILSHEKLIYLNFSDCKSLSHLAESIQMESLQELILSGCSNLSEFPKIEGKMKCLSKICLDGTAIEKLSLEYLTGLVLLSLRDCKNLVSYSTKYPKSLIVDKSGCIKLQEPSDASIKFFFFFLFSFFFSFLFCLNKRFN